MKHALVKSGISDCLQHFNVVPISAFSCSGDCENTINLGRDSSPVYHSFTLPNRGRTGTVRKRLLDEHSEKHVCLQLQVCVSFT